MFPLFIVRDTPKQLPSVFGVSSTLISVFMHREMVGGLVVLAPLASGVKRGYPNPAKISHKTPKSNQFPKWHTPTAQT